MTSPPKVKLKPGDTIGILGGGQLGRMLATAASRLGVPDVGLLTMTEMVDAARAIVQAVRVPVIADADTGYGNPLNVIRTVHEYERAGVSAIHLEDQVAPKRCGHLRGKQVIPAGEMAQKIQAAATARSSPDFLLIARTDARAVEGLDGAIERARRYRDAGADVLFVEAPQTESEVEQVARELGDVPLLFNWAEGGRTPPITVERLRELGYAVVIFPISTLLSATTAIRRTLEVIRRQGTPATVLPELVQFGDFLDFIGLPEIDALGRRYANGH